jgi:hypothetical protein
MLLEQFTQRHELCGYGSAQARLLYGRETKDIWHDHGLQIGGTVLLWIASRAQYEKKALIRCCAECCRESLKFMGDSKAAAEDSIRKVEAWCDGNSDRDAIDAMIQDAIQKARAAEEKPGATAEYKSWLAVSALGRCIRSVSSCSGLPSLVAAAAEAAGESCVAMQQRLADVVRSRLPWAEVEKSIAANKTSPKPRKKTADEIMEESRRLVAQFEQLLSELAENQEEQEAVLTAVGTSAEKIRSIVESGALGSRNMGILRSQLAEMDANDAASAEQPRQRAAQARRPRMSV